jgi:CBS domain-containing protein
MKVGQLMTKEVASCGPHDSLEEAVRIMWEHDCGFVPVTEGLEQRRVIGIVTDRDACMACYTRGAALRQIRVGDVMSTGIRCCKAVDDVAAAEAKMREAQVHRLPVVDESGQLQGVISLADIAREAGREAGSKRRDVAAREVGETLAAIRQPREISA